MNRYTVILKSGKVLSFVVLELAMTYVQAYGGVLVGNVMDEVEVGV